MTNDDTDQFAPSENVSASAEQGTPSWLTPRRRFWLLITAVAVCIITGLFVRFDTIRLWHQQPDTYLTEQQQRPILRNPDGYHYLKTARTLLESEYTPIDNDRYVPQGVERQATPPLLSVLTAAISGVSGVSLETAAAYLSPILGVLLFIPVFLFGTYFAGSIAGVVSGFFALILPFYVDRSNPGWYDTDILNVTLPAAAAYCFLRFSTGQSIRQRLDFLAAGMLMFGMFLWWWEVDVAAGLCVFPLLVGLVLFYRPSFREGLVVYLCIGTVLAGFTIWHPEMWHIEDIYNKGLYIVTGTSETGTNETGTNEGAAFPYPGAFVSEQLVSVKNLIPGGETNGLVLLFGGTVGIGWLVFQYKTKLLFLAPLAVLAGLSVTGARFQIFMAAVLPLGLGFLASKAWELRCKSWIISGGGVAFLVLCAVPALSAVYDQKRKRPSVTPEFATAMRQMEKLTEKDAVIWTTWDRGYPMQYYAQGGTIGDGARHSGKVRYAQSVPFAAYSERLSANWIQFYTVRGMSGLQKAQQIFPKTSSAIDSLRECFRRGPSETRKILKNLGYTETEKQKTLLSFLFPKEQRPSYIVFHRRQMARPHLWFAYGHWDLENNRGWRDPYMPFAHVETRFNNKLVGTTPVGFNIQINKDDGTFQLSDGRSGALRALRYYRNGQLLDASRRYQRDNGLYFDNFATGSDRTAGGRPLPTAVLAGDKIVKSTFHRLFIQKDNNERYFIPIYDEAPLYQLWRVQGDTINNQQQ